ncbi:MFS transporter [Sphingomonas sp. SFZ2018-12]|nr:MFS transporter [Sphingomonas sp. SFZ2018-12]
MMPRGQGMVALAFALVATLFFIWGFATSTVDTLIPSVRSIFDLTYLEAVTTQFAFFIAYALISLPAAALLARIGYAAAIAVALSAMLAGCVGMALASRGDSYPAVLAALFVIASGVTLLQVAANPLVAGLGAPERSHFRLTLVQAFNSMGSIAGPYIGALILLEGGMFAAGGDTGGGRAASLAKIETLFGALGIVVAGLILGAWLSRRIIDGAAASPRGSAPPTAAIGDRWSLAGSAAIFLYVGAEISILSLLINFLSEPVILGISHEAAGKLLALYGIGRMTGRFVGSAVMTRVPVGALLTATAGTAAALCLIPLTLEGAWVGYVTLTIGLFTSITFPAVFTLALERATAPRAAVSGLLVMGITGGAFLPLIAGMLADRGGIASAFVVPVIGFAGVAFFAWRAHRWRGLSR